MPRIALFFAVRVGRIELPSQAWEACVMPLDHTRFCLKIINKAI